MVALSRVAAAAAALALEFKAACAGVREFGSRLRQSCLVRGRIHPQAAKAFLKNSVIAEKVRRNPSDLCNPNAAMWVIGRVTPPICASIVPKEETEH
jgi:hypothetical protein